MVCLLLLAPIVMSQEVTIKDFPIGVAGKVDPSIFKPYYPQLQAIADTMKSDPKALAIVTGSADGNTYRASHDAKNPGLALGRAHALRNLMIFEFGVDSTRIVVQSEDAKQRGGQYRSASIRILQHLFEPASAPVPIPEPARAEAVPQQAESATPLLIRQMGLQFGAGVTTSPFGGIPFVTGAITWRRIVYVETSLGYTLWDNDYTFRAMNLNTRRRISGARLIVYPFKNLPVGAVGGWSRIEQVSQSYYQYVRLSEGVELGLRATPLPFASVTALYNPSMHRIAGESRAEAKNGQFQLSLMVHKMFGGER